MSIKDRLKEVKVAQKLRELQAADSGFQPLLVSGTNIKTINSNSILGSGNLVVGGGGYSEGTSFPGSPTSGDKFYRTDLNWLCFYDGTRWLTCHEYNEPISVQDRLQPAVTNNDNLGYLAIRQDYLPYIQKVYGISVVITTNNGSNYWTALVATVNAAGTLTTLTSFNTSADAAGTRYAKSMTVNQAMTSSMLTFQLSGQRTGTPGAFYPILSVNYRLIVT